MTQPQCPYTKLHASITAAYKTRFITARRLRSQKRWSTRTLIFMSLGLILISLMQSYSIGENIESPFVRLIQAFMAIVILVYSVASDNDNTALIADRIYSSASELTSLSKRLIPLKSCNLEESKYEELCKEYDAILKRYESQSVYDSRYDYLKATLNMPDDYPFSSWDRFLKSIKLLTNSTFMFSRYASVISFSILMIFWVTWGF